MFYVLFYFTYCFIPHIILFHRSFHFSRKSLRTTALSRGSLLPKGFPCILFTFVSQDHPVQSQSPLWRSVPAHLLYNPAYNLRLLQSDRLLQWISAYLVLLPDTGRSPDSGIPEVHFPDFYGLFSFFYVIYPSPCLNLLSWLFQKTPTGSEKTLPADHFILWGNMYPATARTLHDKIGKVHSSEIMLIL